MKRSTTEGDNIVSKNKSVTTEGEPKLEVSFRHGSSHLFLHRSLLLVVLAYFPLISTLSRDALPNSCLGTSQSLAVPVPPSPPSRPYAGEGDAYRRLPGHGRCLLQERSPEGPTGGEGFEGRHQGVRAGDLAGCQSNHPRGRGWSFSLSTSSSSDLSSCLGFSLLTEGISSQVHAIMGKNGSGKSTFSKVTLMSLSPFVVVLV